MSSEETNSLKRAESASASFLISDPAAADGLTPGENWRECFPEIIGRSKPVLKILETVSKIARTDSSVLIYGESGTGKELIAAALHRLSQRSGKRFVALNCSAIPENLLESELFGHEKGAFTGAINRRPGHFELAEGGTLLLDEIGDMPPRLQSKLLRVLQERQYTSVGGHTLKYTNVRIIAATNIDLEKAVAEGRFRLDLYYRLNVLPITLPPLREREGDVSELLLHFLESANRVHSTQRPGYFSSEVIALLAEYNWPGNVRELQNLVERLVIMRNGGEITLEHLPPEYLNQKNRRSVTPAQSVANENSKAAAPILTPTAVPVVYPVDFGVLPQDGLNLPDYIENLENNLILQALDRTGNNKNQAARLLGLNRTTLVERLKKRKIQGIPDET